MKAAVDIGSNTVRMLVGEVTRTQVVPNRYYREVTRLGGNYDPILGISVAAGEKTISALKVFSQIISDIKPTSTRVVATEAVRRAVNAQKFVADILAQTGLVVEIIDGEQEAALSASGVLSGLNPKPVAALIFDIGGGSTEFIVVKGEKRLWQRSYPLGVISLAERVDSKAEIGKVLSNLVMDLKLAGLDALLFNESCELVGTAGSVTTLAAVDLLMAEYDWQRINNHVLSQSALCTIYDRLLSLTPTGRELIAGVEKGRGDLIIHGAAIILALLHLFGKDSIRVSDFGLLEGTLLSMR